MTFNEMTTAVAEARETLRIAAIYKDRMCELILPEIRNLSASNLCALKRELKNYDMHERKWK
jgi:hypothetical protein